MIESAAFKFNLDEAVHKVHISAGRTEKEILDKEPFKESFGGVRELAKQEQLGVTGGDGSSTRGLVIDDRFNMFTKDEVADCDDVGAKHKKPQ